MTLASIYQCSQYNPREAIVNPSILVATEFEMAFAGSFNLAHVPQEQEALFLVEVYKLNNL